MERRTGEAVVMVCQAQGYPEPRIDFFKDGRKIRTNENHVIGSTESSLVYYNASEFGHLEHFGAKKTPNYLIVLLSSDLTLFV